MKNARLLTRIYAFFFSLLGNTHTIQKKSLEAGSGRRRNGFKKTTRRRRKRRKKSHENNYNERRVVKKLQIEGGIETYVNAVTVQRRLKIYTRETFSASQHQFHNLGEWL